MLLRVFEGYCFSPIGAMFARLTPAMSLRAVSRWSHVLPRTALRRRSVHTEAKMASLGMEMPTPAVPKGTFVNFLQIGDIVYLSGHLPQVTTVYSTPHSIP
jgi:hypothetical protein